MSQALAQIEVAADRIRSEFFGTLRELDRRRRAVMDVRRQIREHAGIIILGGVVVASGILVAVSLASARNQSRGSRTRQQRIDSLIRAWKHPDRIAADRRDPLISTAAKIVASVGVLVGSQLIKRKVQSTVRS